MPLPQLQTNQPDTGNFLNTMMQVKQYQDQKAYRDNMLKMEQQKFDAENSPEAVEKKNKVLDLKVKTQGLTALISAQKLGNKPLMQSIIDEYGMEADANIPGEVTYYPGGTKADGVKIKYTDKSDLKKLNDIVGEHGAALIENPQYMLQLAEDTGLIIEPVKPITDPLDDDIKRAKIQQSQASAEASRRSGDLGLYEKKKAIDAKHGKSVINQNKYPYLADLMAKGWMPDQRITGPMLDMYEAAAKKAALSGHPFTPESLYAAEFNAKKNSATGRTSGGRLTVARKQNINTAYQLIDDVMKTNEKLDYSDYQFVGKLESFKNGQLNDPIFTEYMTQRADSLFVLGNALKQNGLTDKSIEVEEQAFNPTLSPKAFKAWVNVQKRALNKAASEMNEDFKFNIKTQSVVEAGQGGQGAPMQEGEQQQGQTQTQGKKITRTGTDKTTGKKVIQYEDGSIEYAP